MDRRSINAPNAPLAVGGYSQGVETTGATRRLYISGQIPVGTDGTVPSTFDEQAKQAWANVEAQLVAAGMSLDHLVKVTMFLADRDYAEENSTIRKQVLRDRSPALTIIIAGIFDATWLLEIEAIAEA